MSWLLMLIGIAAVAYGVWRRLRHARSPAEHAPTGRGTSPGPFFKVTDIVIMIGGVIVFILGVVILYYSDYYAPVRENDGAGPPAAQTGELAAPGADAGLA